MDTQYILHTGLKQCYDDQGNEIDCAGSGQDADSGNGLRWQDEQRFEVLDSMIVEDLLTGLVWVRNCSMFDVPVSWEESLVLIEEMNRRKQFCRNDWRLPNRRELRSLIDHSRKNPALPQAHPFTNVNLGWHWTSTTAARNPAYAWYVQLQGGRMFYGNKIDYSWAWPVSGVSRCLPRSGEGGSENPGYDPCAVLPGRDGCIKAGVPWPEPRFYQRGLGVFDALTGLVWHRGDAFTDQSLSWSDGLAAVSSLAEQTDQPWRMPSINELESLVDVSRHTPALPGKHPFFVNPDGYWSSSTSGFEKDWAYVLYMDKGAVGVGYKSNRDFFLWPVMTYPGNDDVFLAS